MSKYLSMHRFFNVKTKEENERLVNAVEMSLDALRGSENDDSYDHYLVSLDILLQQQIDNGW